MWLRLSDCPSSVTAIYCTVSVKWNHSLYLSHSFERFSNSSCTECSAETHSLNAWCWVFRWAPCLPRNPTCWLITGVSSQQMFGNPSAAAARKCPADVVMTSDNSDLHPKHSGDELKAKHYGREWSAGQKPGSTFSPPDTLCWMCRSVWF